MGGKAAKSSLGELRGWKSSLFSSPGKDSVSCGPTVWRPMAKSMERVRGQVQTESRWFSCRRKRPLQEGVEAEKE